MKKITYYLIATYLGLFLTLSVNASTNFTATSFDITKDSKNEPVAPCYAATVVEFAQGKTSKGKDIGADRSDPLLATGMPDKSNAKGGFVSLGKNGSIVLGFSGGIYDAPGVDIEIWETSFSGDKCNKGDDEKALIELSEDGITWVTYGEICRDGLLDIEGLGLKYVAFIKITDSNSKTSDAYDVDGVVAVNGCHPIITECYGSSVVKYEPSMSHGPIDPARMDPSKGLGQPQGGNTNDFVSLGYGGSIIVGFDEVVLNQPGNDITIVEITHGNYTFASYPESADVYVSQNGVDFYMVGTIITKESASFDIDAAPLHLDYITMVKLVDTTPSDSVSTDGFDLDGIIAINGCSEKPEVMIGGCSATEYYDYAMGSSKGGAGIDPTRVDPMKVVGAPEGTDANVFTTLGYGGSIKLALNGAIMNGDGPDLEFTETSFNQTMGCSKYPEFADIYVSYDNYSWHFAGTVCKENKLIDISDAGDFDYVYYIKVKNNDTLSKTPDGYDLDGVRALHNCVDEPNDQLAVVKMKGNSLEASSYPNPTTGALKISFVSPESSRTDIEVYDMFGRTVGKIFNNTTDSGREYNIDFDGSSLPTGMYIYKIKVGNKSVSKKFVISR